MTLLQDGDVFVKFYRAVELLYTLDHHVVQDCAQCYIISTATLI